MFKFVQCRSVLRSLLAAAFLVPSAYGLDWQEAITGNALQANAEPRGEGKYPWQLALPVSEGESLPYRCEPAFGALRFWDPLDVGELPDGSVRMYVVERRGTVQLVERAGLAWNKRTLLDIQPRVVLTANQAEEGLLGIAFHPEFADDDSSHRGEFFVAYVGRRDGKPANRVSRFHMKTGSLEEADVDSEEILIDQPDQRQSHNGGCLAFGPDGMLYVSLGDDNLPFPNPHPQRIDRDLFSGILRLDVDCRGGSVSHPPPRQPATGRTAGYFIPQDNPFVGRAGVLEEFFALGFRNPWRMSFDRATGNLYVADVGERRREEINVVPSGANCQWDYREGTLDRKDFSDAVPDKPQPLLGVETPPLYEYTREGANRCVVGGHVYRGRRLPQLAGRFVFADQSGRVFALALSSDGKRAEDCRLIAIDRSGGIGVASLGQDSAGELYLATIGDLASETGQILRLRATSFGAMSRMPSRLSETGLLADWQDVKVRPELVPFEVLVPFWSDGARKSRWIAVPRGKRIAPTNDGRFEFPAGTTFVKHFYIAVDERDPPVWRQLETRILICGREGEVFGACYRWSPDAQTAEIVTTSEKEELQITRSDGSMDPQTWEYPGRFECGMCHNSASGGVLGFTPAQLDCLEIGPDGSARSQRDRLVQAGVVPRSTEPGETTPLAGALCRPDDESAPLEQRVRSYLAVNCAVCHNPNRSIAAIDVRMERPLAEQGIVDGVAHHHKALGPAIRIVSPGRVDRSMLALRLSSLDPSLRMPPLGSRVVDRRAVALVEEWIQSLPRPSGPEIVEEEIAEPRDDFRR
jgi:glucose/arabinose dehydrogenase/mono/diheme cytochrome c family protein